MNQQASIAIIQFPGSNCEQDCMDALALLGISAETIWHTEKNIPNHIKGIILPGGFSYGDYLRGGALAALSPISQGILDFAKQKKSILGICNGFQILTELNLLPGTLLKNNSQKFICDWVELKNKKNKSIQLPIAHGEGKYYCSQSELGEIIANKQDLLKYKYNPNGSTGDLAGISNKEGNIIGMMPHPERAMSGSQFSQDGRTILEGFVASCL